METKNKVGVLVILGGIALIGVYWFKKNKPTIGESQAKGLEALSNFYKTGGTDDAFIKGNTGINQQKLSQTKKCGINQSWYADVCYENLTPKEIEELKKAIGTIPDPSTIVSNQISQNLQGADFTNWDLGLNIPTKK
jgi:hypothetical protein